MDANAFRTLVKTATEVLMRHEQQRRAMLHKEVTVQGEDEDVSVTLDIVPDEFEPYAQLKAFDPYGELLAEAKVSAGFAQQGQRRALGRIGLRAAGRLIARARRAARSGAGALPCAPQPARRQLAPHELFELLRRDRRVARPASALRTSWIGVSTRPHGTPPAERGRRQQRDRLLPAAATPAAHGVASPSA